MVCLALLGTVVSGACVWPPAQQETLTGWVVDERGAPIVGATVSVGDRTTRTEKDGVFQLDRLARRGPYHITFRHPDYADRFELAPGVPQRRVWSLPSAYVRQVDPTQRVEIRDERPSLTRDGREGATFRLPPNALVDSAGAPPSGPVRAAIATLDLERTEGPGDWGTVRADGTEGFLVSFGAVFIEFTDPTGSVEYQLRSGVSGDLTLPVTPSMAAHVGATPQAPFWYYDEQDAVWREAGASSWDPVAGAYRGNVDHLSTINTDIAKYNDAACLAVTLDAAIVPGHSLRIRYHSGGTAFGQVPQFVMNDPVNAAYRLPANTNVQIELLNSSNAVLSNLVIEDPPGTPLSGTVVNTGPAIPAGNPMFPPSPFVGCKPVTLRLGAPTVEIRINEIAPAAAMDDPTDDYLTWAPTYALARLATPMSGSVTVVLTNDAASTGGDVRFAQHQSPWPNATTATASTLSLSLPGNQAWVPFMIAGEYGSPSLHDKDAVIEARQNTASGTVLGTKAMMVRVRKDANTLTAAERDRYLFAWQKLRNKTAADNYILIQEMHRLASSAGDEAHGQPAFLTWHRAFLLLVERELQAIDPSVALHYWDWDAAAPNVFHQDFMGAPDLTSAGSIAEPKFSLTNPMLGWDTDLPFSGGELRRNTQVQSGAPTGMKPLDHPIAASLVDTFTDYGPTNCSGFFCSSFSFDVERRSHDPGHGWPCGSGHLISPSRSAADPIFFQLHSQIDREWAYWQEANDRHGTVISGALAFPAPTYYDNAGLWSDPANAGLLGTSGRQKGSFLDDGMWPWDGTSGGVGAEQRPVNQATGSGSNIPNSTPLIPGSAFPASTRGNLWPATASVPKNKDMIDYLGRFDPVHGLGFCYDDVPF